MSAISLIIFFIFTKLSSPKAEEEQCTEDAIHTSKPLNISELFREVDQPPHVFTETEQFSVTFTNLCTQQITVFWLNGDTERANGVIQPNHSITIGTYIGHKFFYRLSSIPTDRLQITTMKRDINTVEFKDPETMRQLNIKMEEEKKKFMSEYEEKTGIPWIAYYPRDPVPLHIFDAHFVGQKHSVSSNHSFYNCYPSTPQQLHKCRDDNILQFEWTVKAISPRVIQLKPALLSDFEVSHLILIANQTLNRSTIGQDDDIEVSYTRTNKGAWLQRYT